MPTTRTIPDSDTVFDLIVIGGGITGAGVARDAALRGLSCLLLEKGDYASGVSSKSTRLIHGGLRYLANFEVDLVAESLRERATLRRLAPYLINPIPLIIPIYKGDPHGRALVSVGIRLYDLLSHEQDIPHYFTSGSEKTLALEPRLNREGLSGSALFYDHQLLMPERLVMENINGAREAGASPFNYILVEKIEEAGGVVIVTARDVLTGQVHSFRSKVLVNAAGPWIDKVRQASDINAKKIISPTKGVHLVLPRLTEQALFVSSTDGRMFFIIPFDKWSLIGTTDTRYDRDLDDVHADRDDVEYLIAESRRILPGLNITREAILYTYAGIRPLAFDGARESKISRKHRVISEGRSGRIVTIAGGKLTTYRAMASDTVDRVCTILGMKRACVSDKKPFPGGLHMDYETYLKEALPDMTASHRVSEETVRHLIGLYGSKAERVLELVDMDPELGETISPESRDIYGQAAYSVTEEGARTLSDIILRRMHLGLTGSRGKNHAEKVAMIASRDLKWSEEEKQHQLERFRLDLQKDKAGLTETT